MYRQVLIFLSLLVCLSCFSCNEEGAKTAGGDPDGSEADAEASEMIAQPVRVETLALKPVQRHVLANGRVESDRDLIVLSETAGRVVKVNCSLGQKMKKGDVLVSVDSEPYRIALDLAAARLEEAEAMAEQAKVEHERAKGLSESGNLSEQVYDQARFGHLRAEATLKTASAGARKARRDLRLCSVRAPFDGEVAARLVELGGMLTLGTPVAMLLGREGMKVKVGVGEDRVGLIRVGQKAEILIPTIQPEAIPGSVIAVGPTALKPTMTYPVEIGFDKLPDSVRNGMVVRAEIIVAETGHAIILPFEKLIDRFGKYYLYVTEGEKVVERQVELGEKMGRDVIIESGVEAGESIVVSGQGALKDGSPIKAVE